MAESVPVPVSDSPAETLDERFWNTALGLDEHALDLAVYHFNLRCACVRGGERQRRLDVAAAIQTYLGASRG